MKDARDKNALTADIIIFDLDGTLIDSSHDIAWSANMTLNEMGYELRDIELIKENIGWGVRPLLEKLMPDEPSERIDEARGIFLKHYGDHLVVDTCLYPGVRETIGFFGSAGKKMAVVTNKPEALSKRILDDLGLSRFFGVVLGGDSLKNKKPHPEPLEKVLSTLGGEAASAVIIGDSPIDCEAGHAAGIKTIGAAYGFRGRAELEASCCDAIIERFAELKDLLR